MYVFFLFLCIILQLATDLKNLISEDLFCLSCFLVTVLSGSHVTTAWRVLRLRIEETALRNGGAPANILNKQSRTADSGWPCSLGVGQGASRPHLKYYVCCELFITASEMDGISGMT
jgi:hypothetical protein